MTRLYVGHWGRPLPRSTPTTSRLQHGNRLRRRWADVARARPDDLVVRSLFQDVGAPADDATRCEGWREHRARHAAERHRHAGIELDIRMDLAAGLQLVEQTEHPCFDPFRKLHDRL